MSTPATAMPARFRRLVDRVRQRDREWFAAHPDAEFRVRVYVPGELYPVHDPRFTCTAVVRFPDREEPGYCRLPILDAAPDQVEAMFHQPGHPLHQFLSVALTDCAGAEPLAPPSPMGSNRGLDAEAERRHV